jgi:lipopolysaccharide assembly outer membrane protein LptD (OstA)
MRLRKLVSITLFAFATSQIASGAHAGEVKGQTLDISGRRVAFDKTALQYVAIGGARAFIEGEKAAVEADEIRYNDITGIMDIRGHVHFLRNGMLTTGDEFKFKVRSRDYLITEPATSDTTRPFNTKLSVTEVSVDRRKEDAESIRLDTESQ